MKDDVQNKINVTDALLNPIEKAEVTDKQRGNFPAYALELLEWAKVCNGGKWEWPIQVDEGAYSEAWVSVLLRHLEIAYDSEFYPDFNKFIAADLNRRGRNEWELQREYDAEVMKRQKLMAEALWEEDAELAKRYAGVLRKAEQPAGLSDVEKRAAFLQEIERREPKVPDELKSVANAVEKALAPVIGIFEKAIMASTPPQEREWWQNVRVLYGRMESLTETLKWGEISKIVVLGAMEESKKPVKDRHSDYLTPLMLQRLIVKITAPGASMKAICSSYGEYLRRRVLDKEQKAVKA
jgi:hypothetical protein